MNKNGDEIDRIVSKLNMKTHPEGGWYCKTYESGLMLPTSLLSGRTGERSCSTSIYFLISGSNFSAFHRLRSDEMWYHHSGGALAIEILDENGEHRQQVIGAVEQGYEPQALAPAGTWFGSHLLENHGWALVGCSVSPGFDFDDFEIGNRENLISEFPRHTELIKLLTRI